MSFREDKETGIVSLSEYSRLKTIFDTYENEKCPPSDLSARHDNDDGFIEMEPSDSPILFNFKDHSHHNCSLATSCVFRFLLLEKKFVNPAVPGEKGTYGDQAVTTNGNVVSQDDVGTEEDADQNVVFPRDLSTLNRLALVNRSLNAKFQPHLDKLKIDAAMKSGDDKYIVELRRKAKNSGAKKGKSGAGKGVLSSKVNAYVLDSSNFAQPLLDLVKSNTKTIKLLERSFFPGLVMKFANTKGRVSLNEFPLSKKAPYLHATADDLKVRAASMNNMEIKEIKVGSMQLQKYDAEAIKAMDENGAEHHPVYFQLLKAFWVVMHNLYMIDIYPEPWMREPEEALSKLLGIFNLSELVVDGKLSNVNANLDALFRNEQFPDIQLFDSKDTKTSIYTVYLDKIVRNLMPYMVVHPVIYNYIRSVELGLLARFECNTQFSDQRDKLFDLFTSTEKYMLGCLRLIMHSYEVRERDKNRFDHLIELHQEIFEINSIDKGSTQSYSEYKKRRDYNEQFARSIITEDIWKSFCEHFKRNGLKMDKAREVKNLKLRAQKRHERVMNQVQRNLKSTVQKRGNVAEGVRLSNRLERLSRPTKVNEIGLRNRLHMSNEALRKKRRDTLEAAAAAAAVVKKRRGSAR